MSNDPRRLSDAGSEASDRVRSLFRSGQDDLPNAGQLGRVEAKLATLLGAAAVGGVGVESAASAGGAKGSAAGGAGLVAKGVVIAAVAIVAAGGLWLAGRASTKPSAPVVTRAHTAATEPAKPAARAPAMAPNAPTPVASGSSAELAHEPETASPRGPSEVELLRQAQSALAKDPKRSLALTQEHQRRFPDGALAQEREVIAVDALSRLGDRQQAKKRAGEFDRRYPDSAHRRKVGAAADR